MKNNVLMGDFRPPSGEPSFGPPFGEPSFGLPFGGPPIDRSRARPPIDRSSARPPIDRSSARPPIDRSPARPPIDRSPADVLGKDGEMAIKPSAPSDDSPGLVQTETPDPEPEKTNFLPFILAGVAAYFLFFKKR